MKCQICKKNSAHIIFTKIVNNEKITVNICNECAKLQGITLKISTSATPQTELSLESEPRESIIDKDRHEKDLSCEMCGLTFADFKEKGFFGCDHCHITFGTYFIGLLQQIHGSTAHKGKTPLSISSEIELKNHLRRLRKRLKKCIESEEFERAAELRDKITHLEEKASKNEI
jgi:protein arginine kinase activator